MDAEEEPCETLPLALISRMPWRIIMSLAVQYVNVDRVSPRAAFSSSSALLAPRDDSSSISFIFAHFRNIC